AGDADLEVSARVLSRSAVRQPAAGEGADQAADHDDAAGDESRSGRAHLEPALEDGREPEGVGGEDEEEKRLGDDRRAQGGDLEQVEELAEAGLGGPGERGPR